MRIGRSSVDSSRCFVFLVLSMLGASHTLAGQNGSIDLFNVSINPDGSMGAVDFGACQASPTLIGNDVSKFAIAIYARQAGQTAAGISGAGFYVAGLEVSDLPAGWTKSFIPAAGLLVVGDVDDPHMGGPSGTDVIRRCNLTWTVDGPADPDCQMTSLTFLGRIECSSPSGEPAIPGVHRFRIVGGGPPSSPSLQCPRLALCNFPIFDMPCVTGGEFILNPSGQDQCSVGVASQTWSQAKGLYR